MAIGTVATLASTIIPALIQMGTSLYGGYKAGKAGAVGTEIQQKQKNLIDDLLASLKGEGSYSNLFNKDEEAFNKSYVEPAQSLFRNKIAPSIQQEFIATGQQRGTGLEDQLTRAGVDIDQLLNQQYGQFQQGKELNIQNIISQILGQGPGVAGPLSGSQAFGRAAQGYFGSEGFANSLADVTDKFGDVFKNRASTRTNAIPPVNPPRKGFDEPGYGKFY